MCTILIRLSQSSSKLAPPLASLAHLADLDAVLNRDEKRDMCLQTKLNMSQVSNWFINA